MLWLGMRRLGYEAEAAHDGGAAQPGSCMREGLREYYDPLTGEGLGARDFAWTSLILEMATADDAESADEAR